jgi:SPP1 gp7 family putative phage head morphogenesis protein
MSAPAAQVPAILPTQPGRVHAVSATFRERLDAQDAAVSRQMVRSYGVVIDDLSREIVNVEQAIAQRVAAGQPTPVSWLHRDQRYKALLIQADQRFTQYGTLLGSELSTAQRRAISLARQHVFASIEAQLPGAQSILGAFNGIPDGALRQITASLSPGAPTRQLLDGFGPWASQRAGDALTNGLAQGLHPSQIARQLRDALDIAPYRAGLIARTELYRSFREANRATMEANADIVEKWLWFAHLGGGTCPACLGMHGTEHELSEPMGTHPACRCTQIPQTKSWEDLGFTGIPETRVTPDQLGDADDYLRRLPLREQRRILGPGRHELWRRGDIKLIDMVRRTESDRWGTNRTVASLADARTNAHLRRLREDIIEDERVARNRATRLAAEAAARRAATAPKPRGWLGKVKAKRADPSYAADVVSEVGIREIGRFIRQDIEKAMGLRVGEAQRIKKQIARLTKQKDATRKKLDAATARAKRQGLENPYTDPDVARLNDEWYGKIGDIGRLRGRLMPASERRRAIQSAERTVESDRRRLAEVIDSGDNFRIGLNRQHLTQSERLLDAARAMPNVKDYDELVRERIARLRAVGRRPGTTHRGMERAPISTTDDAMRRFSEWDDTAVRQHIDDGIDVYPTDWIEASHAHGRILAGRSRRGYHGRGRHDADGEYTEITISGYADETTSVLSQSARETVVHELGHRMETVVPNMRRLERQFYDRRTAGDTERHMGPGFMPSEMTKPDDFFDAYVGKDYGTQFELVSMGYEQILTPGMHERAVDLLLDDEYIDFLLGLLAAV